MKNLVIGYVHATKHKKNEVLQLIAKILDFTSEELEQAIGGGTRGWVTGLWRGTSSKQPEVCTFVNPSTETFQQISKVFPLARWRPSKLVYSYHPPWKSMSKRLTVLDHIIVCLLALFAPPQRYYSDHISVH